MKFLHNQLTILDRNQTDGTDRAVERYHKSILINDHCSRFTHNEVWADAIATERLGV